MEIDLLELKYIINRLFDHIIETRGVHKIDPEKDFYWDIPEDVLYNVDKNPEGLDIGSLHDNWEFISGLLNPTTQPVAYQLTEVAPLLRHIGEILGKKLGKFGG